MVYPIIITTAALLLAAGSVSAQIDLTPKDSFYEVEGIRVPNVNFRNGPNLVSYSPPGNWTLSGGGNKLMLLPKDTVQAEATISVIASREPAPPASEANLAHYAEAAAKVPPREATKVEVLETVVSPMRLSGRPMVEATVSYVFFGQSFRLNVLFLPREREELRFQFAARVADFPELFRAFRASLFSIQGL